MTVLRQLVYRSRSTHSDAFQQISQIETDSLRFNTDNSITGLLLTDGEYFFQVIEGPGEHVQALFEKIKADARHNNIVKICEHPISQRDFGEWNLRTLTLKSDRSCYWLPDDIYLKRDSQVYGLINSFANGRWRGCLPEAHRADLHRAINTSPLAAKLDEQSEYQFAFQPIIDTHLGRISSIEALLRDNSGRYPEQILADLDKSKRYEFDLTSKQYAIAMASEMLQPSQSVSINLMPGALTQFPDAGDYLLSYLKAYGLRPQQLIVEVTENEILNEGDAFMNTIEALRAKGIRVAMDDFGSGYAGLSVLADFLPDKIKLDRAIACNIHEHGPRQAIVNAVMEFATTLGIPLIVEGIEKIDEWLWLQHIGIQKFQGFLFAKPKLGGVEAIRFQA